jgi:membrane fusion protein, multidrug efflux system
MKRWLVMIGLVVALVVVIGGIWGFKTWKMVAAYKAMGVPKQTVSTVRAEYQEWRPQISAIGSLHAARGADLSAEIAGTVDKIHFESGADVKAGTLLVELRAGDDIGRLESLRANAQLAKLNYERAKAQLEAQAVSKAEVDAQEANFKSLNAQVLEQQAVVDKKRIRAPFAGHLGIRAVDPGQYVAAGDKLVTLQTLDPIFVDFYLPQQDLSSIRIGQKVGAVSDTYSDLTFSGIITAIDPKVDVATRNVQIRATLQNPKRKLLPGMFVNVSVDSGKAEKHLTLPNTAISYNPYGSTVFVLQRAQPKAANDDTKTAAAKTQPEKTSTEKTDGDLVAQQIFVTTGPTRGDQIAILSGLKPGDTVVTSGQLKLKNGTAVVVNNNFVPTNDADPKPIEK